MTHATTRSVILNEEKALLRSLITQDSLRDPDVDCEIPRSARDDRTK